MSPAISRRARSPRWVPCILLTGLLLTAGCGGGEATPNPSTQTTPTSTQMLPIVTPTPNILASPSSDEQEKASPAAESSGM